MARMRSAAPLYRFSLVIAFVALTLMLSPAGARADWAPAIEAAPPAGSSDPGVSVSSLSCDSAGSCGAVGTYVDSSGQDHGLLLSEAGGTWTTATEAVLPANAGPNASPEVVLASVSCASAGNCSAVGSYADSSDEYHGLLLDETNGTWTAGIEAVLPANALSNPEVALNSVSCSSAGNCSAVGHYDDSSGNQQGLLLSETGGIWATGTEAGLPANANSSGSPGVSLTSVSCSSPGNCSAVGYYYDGASDLQGLVLSETSGTWSAGTEAGLPANARANPFAVLTSVSCSSAGNCSAIGSYQRTSGVTEGVLLTETGGTWATGTEASLPANAGPNPKAALNSISCGSAGNCAAVGTYQDSSGDTQGLLSIESGGAWGTGTEAALPANADTSLGATVTAVSCSPGGSCAAVGYYDDGSSHQQGLLLDESGGTWAVGTEAVLPADAGISPNVYLDAVSCGSAGGCAVVGSYLDSSGNQQGLLVGESGGTWATGTKAVAPGNAGESPSVSLSSVSCASPGNCAAVGYYGDVFSVSARGLLVNEAGGTWAGGIEAIPPANANAFPHAGLSSVSCASPGDCTAVGSYDDSASEQQGLLVSETGGSWAAGTEAVPPAGAAPHPGVTLNSVSCASAGDCTAVGSYVDDNNTGDTQGLLLTETGGTWAAGTEAALPAGAANAPFVSLGSVSCASPGDCTAVGSYTDSAGHGQGLLLSETGGTWADGVEAGPPANASAMQPGVTLNSVSCASAGNCSAVGTYQDSSDLAQGLLVSETGGTWTSGTEAVLPTNAQGPVVSGNEPSVNLSSVSCASAGNCSAVGTYDDSSGNEQGLLVSENGGAWAPATEAVPPADASTTPEVTVSSVSCASAGNCAAVGRYADDSNQFQGLLLYETGGAWAAGTAAGLPADGDGTFPLAVSSVSCPSAENCGAAGYYSDASDTTHGLLLDSTPSPTKVIQPAVGPSNSAPPVISGTDTVGKTLSTSQGTWSGTAPLTYSYQWQRCARSCVNIATAKASAYKLATADTGTHVRVVVTAGNSAGSMSAESSELGPIKPSTGQVTAAIARVSVPRGTRSRIGALLRNQGYAFKFTAPSGGRLTIDWYLVPAGAHLARASKPVLVASGAKTFTTARSVTVTVKLTTAGRRLLMHSTRLKLTAVVSFTPKGEKKLSKRYRITIKR